MSELKFTCPACGQHLQCEKAYVGHKLPCPSCNAELRVPFSNSPGGAPNALPRAELVLDPTGTVKPPVTVAENPFAENKSDIPKHVDVSAHADTHKPAPPSDTHELHCVCPVCRSELRIPGSAAAGPPPVAEVVGAAKPTVPEAHPEKSAPVPTGIPEEREKQIVAARASRPVEVYPAMKPRLSFILSGGAAPTPSENEAAAHEKKPPEPPAQSFPE